MEYLNHALAFLAIYIFELVTITSILLFLIHLDRHKDDQLLSKTTISDLGVESDENKYKLAFLKIIVFLTFIFLFYNEHDTLLAIFGAICLIFMAVLVFYKRILNSQSGEKC